MSSHRLLLEMLLNDAVQIVSGNMLQLCHRTFVKAHEQVVGQYRWYSYCDADGGGD